MTTIGFIVAKRRMTSGGRRGAIMISPSMLWSIIDSTSADSSATFDWPTPISAL